MRLQRVGSPSPPSMSQSADDLGNRYDVNANDKLEPLLGKGGGSSTNMASTCGEAQPPLHAVNSRVNFNVGGIVFQTLEATVRRAKNKKFKLSDPTFLSSYYDEGNREYFFDRDPEVFRSVLNYWRTGHLHLPASMCGPQLKEELDFWGLREVDIEPCCWNNFNQWMQTVNSLKQLEIDRNPSYMRPSEVMTDTHRICHVTRLRLWKLLTDPSDSKAARIYAYVSLVFVLLAIFSFCASTHKMFDVYGNADDMKNSSNPNNSDGTQIPTTPSNSTSAAPLRKTSILATTTATPEPVFDEHWRDSFSSRIHPALFCIDIVCLVFFTVEYLVKFCCASPRCQFVTSITAVFDILAILPDYVELLLYCFFPEALNQENTGIIDFMPFLRLMRAFRIFRLIRRVPGLWIMMYTLKASFKELSLMLIFLLVGTLLFASIIFFVDDPKVFTSIPHGFWWAIVTMTTVGYGDMAPVTAWGQLVGSVTAICGVLIVGFTIPSLVNNFITYYNHIEFVVQKERLLKILAEEEGPNSRVGLARYSQGGDDEDREHKESRLNAFQNQKEADGRNGSRLELRGKTLGSTDALASGGSETSPGVSLKGYKCVDEERGVGESKGGDGEGEEDEQSQLFQRPSPSYGIPLVSLRSLSKQKINFAD